MKIKGTGDIEGRTVIANVSTKMDYSRGHNTQCANAERIVACVNAFDGIEDPKHFINQTNKLQEEHIELRSEIKRLREQINQLENLAHEIVTVNCKQHVAPSWRGKINAILGNNAGGGQ